jgi:hypothetical protein
MDLNDLIRDYVKARDLKKEMADRHKAEIAPINDVLDQIESVILNFLNESGQESAATKSGTAYITKRESFTVEDPAAFREFVEGLGDTTFFESRASKEAVTAYLQETGELPPGLKYSAMVTVGVRRS